MNGFPALLQIQSLHIASFCLGSFWNESKVKEIFKDSCPGKIKSIKFGCLHLSSVL